MSRFTPEATLMADFYKVSHRIQYPAKTEKVYSTWTPRASRINGIDKVVCFGVQSFIKEYIVDYFNDNFFKRPVEDVIKEYTRVIKYALQDPNPDASHIKALHELGYLPIEIKAVPEGTLIPIRCPMLTIENTLPEFFWLTNYLETLMSCELWMPMTSATIALQYRKLLNDWAKKTNSDMIGFVPWQGHDFSMRGMSSIDSAAKSGAGHLLSFYGSDTIPAISYLEQYYGANIENELVGGSVPATEHSVMCAGGKEDEYETFRRIVTELYPKGIVSIVSDTWDLWHVLSNTIPSLKNEIMKRDGKIVIRPDSGNPVDIICGDESSTNISARKGVIEILWDIFGGTITKEGYKQLDPHIGCIYGDAITIERCTQICERLANKGFASTNMVYGIGSFTYQYNTRDTFGFALKSTYVVIDGKEINIFKDPVTDNGIKKSQTGKVAVVESDIGIGCVDGLNAEQENNITLDDNNILETVFENGYRKDIQSLTKIRERISKNF